MENDKTTLLVIALVAIVAIVAAFGIVNMTGFAVLHEKPIIIRDGPCQQYAENGCGILQLDSTNCQKCCALGYACSMYNMRGNDDPILDVVLPKDVFNWCMDSCPANGGGQDVCSDILSCSTCNNLLECYWSLGECHRCTGPLECDKEMCLILEELR